MYRVEMNEEQYEDFKRKAKIAMLEQGISRKELANRINYSENSVRCFFSKQNTKFIAFAIASELGMEIKDET
jgi:ribosome-binding protein aMBF1 (putative translation factor)